MSLAFHHPSMRVLRDISLRRLSALEMYPPTRPMLSCINVDFYPGDSASTCTHIADLDENSVRWTECVQAMWNREGIRYFLELGPQDTLCSLVTDNEPGAKCLTVGRKGKEVEGMRQACAHLYSLGYLRRDVLALRAQKAASGDEALQKVAQEDFPLILLDISMPGLSGEETCIELRKMGKTMRIIAYTAHAFPEEREKFMAGGFDDILVKPVNRAQLEAVVSLP